MGVCAVMLGVYMLLRTRRLTDSRDCRKEQRKLNRLMKKHCPAFALTAVEKEFTAQSEEILWVWSAADIEPQVWKKSVSKQSTAANAV